MACGNIWKPSVVSWKVVGNAAVQIAHKCVRVLGVALADTVRQYQLRLLVNGVEYELIASLQVVYFGVHLLGKHERPALVNLHELGR